MQKLVINSNQNTQNKSVDENRNLPSSVPVEKRGSDILIESKTEPNDKKDNEDPNTLNKKKRS